MNVLKDKSQKGLLQYWEHDIFWESGNDSIDGTVGKGGKYAYNNHGDIGFSISESLHEKYDYESLMKKCSIDFECDFSFLHLREKKENCTPPPSSDYGYWGQRNRYHCLILSTHRLRKYLPDLYWGTVFGPAYVRHFGKDRLLSSPAFKVEEWGNEMVYIQLSENLLDLRSDRDGVRKEADRVKEHLGLDSFFNPEKGPGGEYRVLHIYDHRVRETWFVLCLLQRCRHKAEIAI
ncbi:MAG: hypothetical protein MZV49_09205 [Rhodopseudomonas palustris]|nr:hypothetical protein [Rhodopseudomonas palustris]